jgi:tetratricopeptide (TPR) repeat protein
MQLIRKRLASTPDSKAGIKTGVRKTWCILVMVLAMVIQSPRGLALDEGNSKNAVLGREDLRKGHADNRKPATVPTAKPKTEYHFLDKQQELLAKSGKWEDFARFAGKGDLSRLEIHVDSRYSYQDWTESEKTGIGLIVSKLWQTAPGLLIAAARGKKIAFIRVSTLPFSAAETHVTVKDNAGGYAATTAPDGILVANRFFVCPTGFQYHGIVHELVHAADYSSRVSFSKEWIDFALPKIEKVRDRFFKSDSYDYYAAAKSISKEKLWPSIYGCENLREALAEYLTTYVEGTDFPVDSNFIAHIAPHILQPSERERSIEEHFLKGRLAYQSHDQELALAEFLSTKELAPTAAEPYAYMSYCYGMKKDYSRSIELGKKAQAYFEAAGVPIGEPTMMHQTRYLMDCEGYLHQYDEAKKLLDLMLSAQPDDRDALYKRYWYYRREEQYAAAAQDYYASVCGPQRIKEEDLAMVAGSDPKSALTWSELQRDAETNLKCKDYAKAQKYCDQAIALNADAIEPYITRIRLHEAMGNKQAAKSEFFALEKKIKARKSEVMQAEVTSILHSERRASPTTFGEGANSVTEFVHGNSQVLYGFDWLGGNR